MAEPDRKCAQCDAQLPADSTGSVCPKCLLQAGFETQPVPTADGPVADSYQPTFIPPTAEELAPQFPQLEILEVIGHGGMGVVYKARQIELDRIVALKILRPGISQDPDFAERFQREARALAKLNHPNIITVYDFGRRDSLFYFIMEFVDGANLRHLNRVGSLQPAEALRIVPQVCSALQYAHDNGVVHRDIKPENILISTTGDVRIADFGLAKLAGVADAAPLTGTWQVMGTPHYMAPEQFEKPTTVDHRADIYSLGVVIYELLTGELPIGRFPLPSDKVQVDVRLDEVVLRSLDKEPDRRYQHVTDVATAVEEASVPPETSRVNQVRQWASEHAESLKEKAKGLREKSAQWQPRSSGFAAWLGEHRQAIGLALMWCGVIDVLASLLTLTESFEPANNQDEFLAAMSLFAGGTTFYLGRQIRTGVLNGRLLLAALFCLIPWWNVWPLVMIARLLLVALALLACLSPVSRAESNTGHSDNRDQLKRLLQNVRSVMSLRILFFSMLRVAGWITVCSVTFWLVYEAWYRHSVPASFVIRDESGLEVRPQSLAFEQLHIEATSSGETRGLLLPEYLFRRNTMRFSIQNRKRQTPTLEVHLPDGLCRTISQGQPLRAPVRLSEQVLVDWFVNCGVETHLAKVETEINVLYQFIELMRRTRGTCDRLSIGQAESFPALAAGIRDVLSDESLMRNNLIPVGRLLESDYFDVPRALVTPRPITRPQPWAERLYFGTVFIIFSIGLARVIRVLYLHLWKPPLVRGSEVQRESAVSWSLCSLGLASAGILCCLLVLVLHNEVLKTTWAGNPAIPPQLSAVSRLTVARVLMGYLVVSFAIAICGFLARPFFRRVGWWVGALGGTLAIVSAPLNLLTFPTGLAAWVGLTDADVHGSFRRMHSRDESVEGTDAPVVS